MKQRKIILLIIVTTLALAGVIIIQLSWLRSAIRQEEEQFNKGVEVGMQAVVNQLFASKDHPFSADSCTLHCNHQSETVPAQINVAQLDSLLEAEFKNVHGNYFWGIFNESSHKLYAGNTGKYSGQITHSRHQVSLSCLYDQEKLMLGLWFPEDQRAHLKHLLPLILVALLLILIVISAFSYTILAIFKQKKLSEMKNDFINNMTHEFKTPISTISLATEMMLSASGNPSTQHIKRYAGIIQQENLRLKEQVEQVLQIAVLEKGQYKLTSTTFDAHQVIKECVRTFELSIRNEGGFIMFKPRAERSMITADRMHFINMINNLLDNASKYARVYPEILVISRNDELKHVFSVEIHDKGIGIDAGNLKYIFRKLYRVPTGNKHDVKGFGLGLFYVKSIVESHGGSVTVSSVPGMGSVFTLSVPQVHNKTLNLTTNESESKNFVG